MRLPKWLQGRLKMALCPNCKKIIEDLRFEADVQTFGNFSIFDDGYENWETKENGEWNNLVFYCPECNTELFYDNKEAREFLENKDELKEMVAKKVNQK